MRSKYLLITVFQIFALIAMLAALYAIFIYAPVEKTMGIVQKIFYIHLPSAFLAFFAFFVTFLASFLYLVTRKLRWDTLALCSAEIGVLFCTIVLITGPIWAKPTWNVWWTWDPRLTTTLILWLVYVAYLMLRNAVREHQKSAFSAVFGIVGFVNVPVTFFAIRLWRSIHPAVITSRGIHISTPMKYTLILTFIAFCMLYVSLLMSRMRLEKLKIEAEEMRDLMEDRDTFNT